MNYRKMKMIICDELRKSTDLSFEEIDDVAESILEQLFDSDEDEDEVRFDERKEKYLDDDEDF